MAEEPVMIVLDGEPKGKGRPRFSRKSGVAYTPSQTRSYETALRWAAQVAMRTRKPLDCPLSVSVTAMMPVPRSWSKRKQESALRQEIYATGKPDADNLLKMLDALNGIVFRDDSLIITATIMKVFAEKPSLRINVMPLNMAA